MFTRLALTIRYLNEWRFSRPGSLKILNFFLCVFYDAQFVNIQLRKEDDSFMIELNICLLTRFNSTTLLTRSETFFRN